MTRRALALTLVPATFALAACGGSDNDATAKDGKGPITVTATDTTCEVARTQAPAGTIEFTVTNKGTKTNEFYLYAAGDRILGEVENIAPGLTRSFHVEVAEPGTYETACKPGMVGKGIRHDFTVTGASAAPQTDDAKIQAATASYARFVGSQADALLARTTEFVGLVKAGKVEQAKALYPVARSYWERIEPVAESFGELDPRIDGREDVVEEGMKFTGYHRLEQDLWVKGLQADTNAIADQLLADVTTIVTQAKQVEFNGLQLANGSKALLDEMATGKITGEEERYSHTDLWDFAANWEGSKGAVAALRPVLQERDPELVASYDKRAAALDALLTTHQKGEGYALYTDLTPVEVRALSDALDAVAEDVSKVAGVVASA
jgi:iron uptake system component EfeO